MKAILIKHILVKADEGKYFLFKEDEKGFKIQVCKKLSKQNCDEIFGIIDVEKLAEENKNEYVKRFNNISKSDYMNGFEEGFNKAMELNKDKVFTEENVRQAYIYGVSNGHSFGYPAIDHANKCIQSLQQPTEIEVEIEMEVVPDFYSRSNEDGSIFTSNKKEQPKLDSSGCLILIKKI